VKNTRICSFVGGYFHSTLYQGQGEANVPLNLRTRLTNAAGGLGACNIKVITRDEKLTRGVVDGCFLIAEPGRSTCQL
jgi:hypothetical protein